MARSRYALLFLLAARCGGGESAGPDPSPPPPPPPPPAPSAAMIFSKPIAGEPMREVFYGAYLDHGTQDYDCRQKRYPGHHGTDILLRNFVVQDSGVGVLAAAPGTVFVVRDGVPDRSTAQGSGGAGNNIAIEHGNGGPISYYYHLRKGSIRVSLGATVNRGDTIALVGSSGNSNWPHLHFEVTEHAVVIDPFRGDCNAVTTGATWREQLPWQGEFAVLDAGISDRALSFAELLERPAEVGTIVAGTPLVFWANLLNIQASATRTIVLDASGNSLVEVSTGPVSTFSAIFLAATFDLRGLLSQAGTYTVALRVTEGSEREVARRTFTFDPGAVPSPSDSGNGFRRRAPVVWISPQCGHSLK